MNGQWLAVAASLVLTFSQRCYAQDLPAVGSYLDDLLKEADDLSLGRNEEWLRLLYYAPTWFGRDVSMVDGPGFFVASNGRSDPEAELRATLRSFFSETEASPPSQCKFPARYEWLKRQLRFDSRRLKDRPCPELEDWLAKLAPDRISLVFSSFYINNPASMFGHTFLRFHKKSAGGRDSPALLDHALGYAANPSTENPLYYAILGIGGGFSGTLTMMPYYMKVQEYNNFESRDLWEYELDFTQDQIDLILRSIWEIGANSIDYYYFDDNCSFVVLAILEAGRADLNLTGEYSFWVSPGDTVRTVARTAGLVRTVHYRPSALSRFRERFSLLTEQEQDQLGNIYGARDLDRQSAAYRVLSATQRARLLDGLTEYLDYDETFTAAQPQEEYQDFRLKILKARAEIPVAPTPLTSQPKSERPEFGHDSTRLFLGIRQDESNTYGYQINWRPALHDISSVPAGYSKSLELRFFDTTVDYLPSDKHWRLASFSLLEILSIQPVAPLLPSKSWNLQIGVEGMEENSSVPRERDRKRFFLRGGIGRSWRLLGPDLLGYVILIGNLDNEPTSHFGEHAGLGAKYGMSWAVAEKVQISAKGLAIESVAIRSPRSRQHDLRYEGSIAYMQGKSLEFRAEIARVASRQSVGVGVAQFF